MLINPKEIKSLKALLHAFPSLAGTEDSIRPFFDFFSEHPHLLMLGRFDEHMQREATADVERPRFPKNDLERASARRSVHRDSARWWWPLPERSLTFRQPNGQWLQLGGPVLVGRVPDIVLLFLPRQSTLSVSRSIEVPLQQIVSNLESHVTRPSEEQSLLWTPQLWTSKEQERQRKLVVSTPDENSPFRRSKNPHPKSSRPVPEAEFRSAPFPSC